MISNINPDHDPGLRNVSGRTRTDPNLDPDIVR